MSITTKRGDGGETDVFGCRLPKNEPLVGLIGDLDELNAALGVCAAHAGPALRATLETLQAHVFIAGSEAAAARYAQPQIVPHLGLPELRFLEERIAAEEAALPPLTTFILPGGTVLAAELHRARTVCRRAERSLVLVAETHPALCAPLPYVNRLSDLLFLLARRANADVGAVETPWKGTG